MIESEETRAQVMLLCAYVLEDAGRVRDGCQEGAWLDPARSRRDLAGFTCIPKLSAVSFLFTQQERAGEPLQVSQATGTSLTERLKHLERLIRSSREEEVASELHLSALLDMVDI